METWYPVNELGIEINRDLKVQKLRTKKPVPVRNGLVNLYNPKTKSSDKYSAKKILEHATGGRRYEKVSGIGAGETLNDATRHIMSTLLAPHAIDRMSVTERLALLRLFSRTEIKKLMNREKPADEHGITPEEKERLRNLFDDFAVPKTSG
jgi:hypothetical protein